MSSMALQPAPAQVERTPIGGKSRIPLADHEGRKDRSLTDEQIVDQIRRLRQESIDRNSAIMAVASECWAQYRNVMDFSEKASWESRITVAKGHAAIKHFTANIMRLLTQSPQWITVEDVVRVDQDSFAPFVEKGVLKMAELAGFKEVFRDALEYSGAAMFGCMKVIWQFTEANHSTIEQGEKGLQLRRQTRAEGGLGLYSIDPWKIHFGPRQQGGRATDYFVEDSDADLADLNDLGGFENLDKLKGQDQPVKSDDPYASARKEQKERANDSSVRRRVELWDYWGDLIDPETQKTVARDVHVIVANREHIIKYQEQNPLWDDKPPYVVFSPLIVSGRFPGGGILEMSLEVKRAIDRIAQMWETHLQFSAIPMFEVEAAALENPEQLSTGVFPGKTFIKKPGQGPNQIVRPIVTQPLQADAFNAFLAYDKEFQRGTFIPDQVQGLLDQKGETTATEVQQTAVASTLILSDIAMHLEHEALAPIGEMIWDRMFQFMDSTSVPSWSQIVGGELGQFMDSLPVELRQQVIRSKYSFQSMGLSRAIDRSQQGQKLLQWLQVIGQLGPAQAIINIPEVIMRFHESMHLPEPEKLLVPNWRAVFQQFQLAMLAQANPLAQMEAKNEATMGQIEAETQQIISQETERGKQAILKEAARAAFNQKESKERE